MAERIRDSRKARGTVLIVALWVTVALTGMVLTLAFSMRTEAMAAANRVAQAEAEAALRGAEQWMLSVVDQEQSTPGTIAETDMEARQIGRCQVWVVRPDYNDSSVLAYGLMDEAGKVDLNSAPREMLLNLPGMTEDVADAIIQWRGGAAGSSMVSAGDDYYMSLPQPYHLKGTNYESVEELLLVKDVTTDLLYGYDKNRNGVIDEQELTGDMTTAIGATSDTGVGFAPFVTIYGVPATATTATATATGTQPAINVNNKQDANLQQLQTRLTNAGISASRAEEIVSTTRSLPAVANKFEYYWAARLNQDEFAQIYTAVTAGQSVPANGPAPATQPAGPTVAKINIHTAPREVLLCLPGLNETDVEAIVTQRQTTAASDDLENLAWLAPLLDQAKARSMGGLVTGTSKVYSGDIVAISPDGRSFRRSRVVVSAASGSARIVYRRDMTSAGWPLPAEIRQAIRSGSGYEAPLSGGTLQ